MCYKPYPNGTWSDVSGGSMVLVPKPTFTPMAVVAGHPGHPGPMAMLTFSGTQDNDLIVVKPNATDCSQAHSTADTIVSLQSRPITASKITIFNTLTTPGWYKLCYATHESSPSSGDDYAPLDTQLRLRAPVEFEPTRTVAGGSQVVQVNGGYNGAQILWHDSTDCSDSAIAASTNASSTSSGLFTITQTVNFEVICPL